jgi:hypothetical protein
VRLAAGLRDLLGLYFIPDETAEHRARQIAIFVKDLGGMSDDVVGYALTEWRRKQDRRPSPAALLQLCAMRRNEAAKATALRNIQNTGTADLTPLAPEDRAAREAVFERCAKSAGFLRVDGRWVTPEAAKEKPARVPHWTETAPADHPWFKALELAREKAK